MPSPSPLAAASSPRDLVQARLVLEPELARLAALNGTVADLETVRQRASALRAAGSWGAFDRLDAAFHRGIAEAAGNAVLLALYETLEAMRLGFDWGRLAERGEWPGESHGAHDEHDRIARALGLRDRDGAAAALRHHLLAGAAALGAPFM